MIRFLLACNEFGISFQKRSLCKLIRTECSLVRHHVPIEEECWNFEIQVSNVEHEDSRILWYLKVMSRRVAK